MLNICDHKVETVKDNENFYPKMVNYENNVEIDCNNYKSPQKSEFNNTQNKQETMLFPTEYMSPEDCANVIPKEQNFNSLKWKGKKYFPHFKTKVVSYALKHSIKKAASDFKVNKGTISGWIHESQQKNRGHKINEIDFNCVSLSSSVFNLCSIFYYLLNIMNINKYSNAWVYSKL